MYDGPIAYGLQALKAADAKFVQQLTEVTQK